MEFAAELSDMVCDDILRVFSSISRSDVKITLIESLDHILNTYDKKISDYTEDAFKRQSIEILTNKKVVSIEEGKVVVVDGETEVKEEIECGFCLWSTGAFSLPLFTSISFSLSLILSPFSLSLSLSLCLFPFL